MFAAGVISVQGVIHGINNLELTKSDYSISLKYGIIRKLYYIDKNSRNLFCTSKNETLTVSDCSILYMCSKK